MSTEKAVKVADMSLEDLYHNPPKGKHTPSVIKQILIKEDFSVIRPDYCNTVCQLSPTEKRRCAETRLAKSKFDIVVLKDFDFNEVPKNSYQSNDDMEYVVQGLIRSLSATALKGFTVGVLNVMKCRPADKKITTTKVGKCSPYVLTELHRMRPKLVIAIGASALKVFKLKETMKNSRGKAMLATVPALGPYQAFDIPVVSTIHPKSLTYIRQNSVGVFWGPDYYSVIERDFEKAGEIARGEWSPCRPDEGEKSREEIVRKLIADGLLVICKTTESALSALAEIEALPPQAMLAFDLEATGLEPFSPDAKIISIQFGFKNTEGRVKSISIPLWHRENTTVDADRVWEVVTRILTGPNPKFGHNTKFDALYIRATKRVKVNNIFTDTMFLLHAKNSGIKGCLGLKAAVWDYLPETGLGGYEDDLPKLTTKKQLAALEGESDDNDDSSED